MSKMILIGVVLLFTSCTLLEVQVHQATHSNEKESTITEDAIQIPLFE